MENLLVKTLVTGLIKAFSLVFGAIGLWGAYHLLRAAVGALALRR